MGAIDRPGLVILAGVTHDDQPATVERLAEKVWTLRILHGERSCQEENAPILVVSQFTLYADITQGPPPIVERGGTEGGKRTSDRGFRFLIAHPRR